MNKKKNGSSKYWAPRGSQADRDENAGDLQEVYR